MKTINRMGAQGDLLLRKVEALPEGLEPVPAEGGRLIVAHSETGHHHWLAAPGCELWRSPGDPLIAYLRVSSEGADLVHARPWDTHETIRLPGGVYELRRQREYTPEGWRRVED